MLFDMLQVYVNNASSTVKVRKESFLLFFPSLSKDVQVLHSHVHMGVEVSHTFVYAFKIYAFSVIPYNLKILLDMVSGSHKYVAFIEEGRRKLLIEMLNTIES